MSLERLDDALELVRYVDLVRVRVGVGVRVQVRVRVQGRVGGVHLVGVEHEEDDVATRREPAHYILVAVLPVLGLLLAREYAGGVDERAAAREVGGDLAAGEAREEGVAELGEVVERGRRVRHQRVARQLTVGRP
eukprot:scaffold50126_cov42-Phaeocystis_antarctica.AAC.1